MSTNPAKDAKKAKPTSALNWVSDKLAAGAARVNGGEFQDIEVAVVKATNHDVVAPKEKHVRTLREVIATSQNRKKVVYIIHGLYERLVLPNETWLIVLKTLMVFHKLMKTDGEAAFKQEMIKYKEKRKLPHLLSLNDFRDSTQKENWDFSAFVRVYSLYLEERLMVFEQIRFDVERDGSSEGIRFKSATSQELLSELPKLQKLLQRVLACVPEGSAATHEVVMECMRWILTECFRLFRIIAEGVISLAEQFFEMDRVDARKGLEMYKESVNSTAQMQTFFSSVQALSVGTQLQFPQLNPPPEDFIEQMEEYVKDATGRTTTRKFPSTILRNARGAPSPAILPGGQQATSSTSANPEKPIDIAFAPKSGDQVEETSGQQDLLSLDVLALNDPVEQITAATTTTTTTTGVMDPFGDTVFGTQPPTETITAPPATKESGFMDSWNQPPVATTSALPTTGSTATQQQQTTIPAAGFQEQSGSSPFDDFFGGGPMAQPPPPPPPVAQAVQDPVFAQPLSGNPYQNPAPVVSGFGFQSSLSNNPFGDSGFAPVAPSPGAVHPAVNVAPQFPTQTTAPQPTYPDMTQKQQYQYSGLGSQFTGPAAFADPFDGLTPALQKKTSFAPPGAPMRAENNEMPSLFDVTTTTGGVGGTNPQGQMGQQQQGFAKFN